MRRPRRKVAGERRRPASPDAATRRPAAPAQRPAVGRKARARRPVATERRSGLRAPLIALVAALLLLGGVLGVTLRSPGGPAEGTDAAVAAARTSLTRMLSFDYRTVDASSRTVGALLTGSFRTQFEKTMSTDIAPLAKQHRSVVTASVAEIGVRSASADTVRVQAFVDQSRTTDASPTPAVDQNRVLATLTKVDGRWLVSALTAY